MGDRVMIGSWYVCGHAVEDYLSGWGTPKTGRIGFGTPALAAIFGPPFRGQPQNRLQMAGPFSSSRRGRLGEPLPSAPTFASSTDRGLDPAHLALTPASFALGRQENPSAAPGALSARPAALRAFDSSLFATPPTGAPTLPPRPQRAAIACPRTDARPPSQSRLDGGFQGLVPHRRRPAAGTPDRARSVQPLWLGFAVAVPSGRCRYSPGFPAFVSSARIARHHSGGQRLALRRNRRPGVVALVGVVAAAGHWRRVPPPRPARRQRGP